MLGLGKTEIDEIDAGQMAALEIVMEMHFILIAYLLHD